MDKQFWNKVTLASFFLSFIIVLTHTISNIEPKFEQTLITHGILRYLHMYQGWAVHVFFMLSGILFFRDYDYNKIIQKYKSRFRSLVIPYLGWNVIGLIFWGVIGVVPILANNINEMPIYDWTFHNLIEGIFHYKYNCVFWFIFELIVLIFISPVIYTFIRHKYIGLIFIICFMFFSVLGKEYFIGMRCPETWYVYMVGGYLTIHCQEYISECKISLSAFISLITMFVISILFYFKMIPFGYVGVFVFQTIAFLALWHSINLLLPLYRPWMNGLAIFIYAAHYNISMGLSRIFNFTPPHPAEYSIPALFLTTIATMFLCIIFARLGQRFVPNIYRTLNGGR